MFTAEDGSGVTGANSFVTVAAADDYWTARNEATWAAATEAQKQAALLDATAFVSGRYRGSWPGTLYSTAQGLDWPRLGAYDEEGRLLEDVPEPVVSACCEMALVSLESGRLNAALDRGGEIKREKIGPLETEYMDGAPGETSYPVIDALLSAITSRRTGEIQLRRG